MTETTDGRPSETPAPILRPFYLTFGVQYKPDPNPDHGQMVHPHWPDADAGGWVTIMATDYRAARQLASLYFDDKFSTVYEDFDTTENRRFFKLGLIGVIIQGAEATPASLVPRFTPDNPLFHGYQHEELVAVRIMGELKRRDSFDALGYDVALLHRGECAERGKGLFKRVFETDDEVMAFELDWTDLPDCDQCHTQIPYPKSSIS